MRIARGSASVGLLLLLGFAAPAPADEDLGPTILDRDSGGLLELAGESRLVVSGMSGTFSFRVGKPGELRYEARTLDNQRSPRNVLLWAEDRALRLGPVEGDDGAATLIEVAVPPELAVKVDVHDSLVQASGLSGRLEVGGRAVDLVVRAIKGPVALDVAGGKILISGAEQAVELEGSGLDIRVEYANGTVFVGVKDSHVVLADCQAAIEGEIEKTVVEGQSLRGPVQIEAEDSELSLSGAVGGGTLELSGTPLVLSRTGGVLDLTTDAAVEFTQHDGQLKILGYGAAVHGSGSKGTLDVETDGAEVRLDQIAAKCAIRGQELDLQMMHPSGEISIRTTSSKIVIKKASGPLLLENEYGDIDVEESIAAVDVKIRDGNARLVGLKAPLRLTSEGGNVEARWFSLSAQEDSTIQCTDGQVDVQLPAGVNLKVEVETAEGQVQADLPGVAVSEDGHSASGVIGPSRAAPQTVRPTLHVHAGGDIHLGALGR